MLAPAAVETGACSCPAVAATRHTASEAIAAPRRESAVMIVLKEMGNVSA